MTIYVISILLMLLDWYFDAYHQLYFYQLSYSYFIRASLLFEKKCIVYISLDYDTYTSLFSWIGAACWKNSFRINLIQVFLTENSHYQSNLGSNLYNKTLIEIAGIMKTVAMFSAYG